MITVVTEAKEELRASAVPGQGWLVSVSEEGPSQLHRGRTENCTGPTGEATHYRPRVGF